MVVTAEGVNVLRLENAFSQGDFEAAIEHLCILLQARVIDRSSASTRVIDYCGVPYRISYDDASEALLMASEYPVDACSLSDIQELFLLRAERVAK